MLGVLTAVQAFLPSNVGGTVALTRRVASSVLYSTVRIEKDETSVGTALCSILEKEYSNAVKTKGTFVFGISGGSMLKMLSHLKGHSNIDWSLCTMAFCSHRCVALDDDAATYHKAKPAFLQSWMDQGLKVITLMGTTEAEREADAYEANLLSLPPRVLPHTTDGYPIFDLLLIGVGVLTRHYLPLVTTISYLHHSLFHGLMVLSFVCVVLYIGTDGHVGSIYPHQEDVKSKRVVVPVTAPISKVTLPCPCIHSYILAPCHYSLVYYFYLCFTCSLSSSSSSSLFLSYSYSPTCYCFTVDVTACQNLVILGHNVGK